MGLLMFSARVHDLMRRKSNIEYRLTQLTRKLSDLQDYATYVGNCADGNFDIGEALALPGSTLGRVMGHAGRVYNESMAYANANAPYYQQMWMQQYGGNLDANSQAMMNNYIMSQLYKDAADKMTQKEVRRLKREEEKMKNEKEQQETLLKEVEQELQSARQARDAGIKEMAPKYVAGGQ